MPPLRIFILVFACIGFIQPASANSVYRWVDDDGVTHFSSTPPNRPASETPVEQVADGARAGASGAMVNLSGVWWGMLGSRTTSLRFTQGGFRFTHHPNPHSMGDYRVVASGQYSLNRRTLTLAYQNHEIFPDKVGTQVLYEVAGGAHGELHLLTDVATEELVFRQLTEGNASRDLHQLLGQWQDLNNASIRYTFTDGAVTVHENIRNWNWREVALLQWRWSDPEIILDYIVDFKSPIRPREQRGLRWNLRDIGAGHLTAVETESGRTIELRRL